MALRNMRMRRSFLKGALGIGGGIGALSFGGAFGVSSQAASHDIATILNLAATAEALAVTFYYTALTGAAFHIGEQDAEHLKLAMDAEMHHLQILGSLGARPMAGRFHMPEHMLEDASVFVATGLRAESTFTGAYIAATHQLAALGQARLAATAAQHGASEAQHYALLGHIAGLAPNAQALPSPDYYQIADAAPALAPFLVGGAGFGDPVGFPSSQQYNQALGGLAAVRVRAFVQAYGPDARTARAGG